MKHARIMFGCLLAVSLLLAGCSGSDMTAAEHLQRAKQFLAQGDTKAGIIEFKNALRKDPDNAEARWLLGELYLELGAGADAEKELLRARELGVGDEVLLPKLLKAMLIQGKYSELAGFDIPQMNDPKAQADALALRGIALFYQKKQEEAEKALRAALQLDPQSLQALVGMARLVGQKDLKAARAYLDQALTLDEHFVDAWTAMGDLLQLSGEYDKALEAYDKAIANSKGAAPNEHLKRATLYIRLKQYDKARKDITYLKKKYPKNAQVLYTEGMLYFYSEQFPQAEAALEEALRLNDKAIWSRYYLGAVQFIQGKQEQARDNLSRFLASLPGYVPARKILALIKLRDREYAEVEKLMRPVVEQIEDDVYALNFLAVALLEQGQTDEAIKLFEKVADLQPESGEARMRLGLGLLLKGDKERAFDTLKTAIDADADLYQANAVLILGYLKDNKLKQARQAAERFVKRKPDSAIAHILLGKVYLASNDTEAAAKAFAKAVELQPGDIVANTHLAALALDNQQYDKAEAYYQAILAKYEKHLATLQNLAALEARRGNEEKAKQILQQAIEAHPDAVQPRVLLANKYLKENNPERARSVIGELLNEKPGDPLLLGVMAESLLALKQYDDAVLILKQLIKNSPKNAQAYFKLAQAHARLGQTEAAKEALATALELKPDLLQAKILRAHIALSERDMETARELLAEIKQQQRDTDDIALLELEGAVLADSGKLEEALPLYRKLFDKAPSIETLKRLTRLQWLLGQKALSTQALEQWVGQNPDDVAARLELANNYLMGKQIDAALEQYRKILEQDKNNLLALNNLAWHLRKKNPQQALVYATRASELAPELPGVMDTLAMVLLETGELARAGRMIERALAKRPDDPSLLYHKAIIDAAGGQKEAAKKALQNLLKEHQRFREREEAEAFLQTL